MEWAADCVKGLSAVIHSAVPPLIILGSLLIATQLHCHFQDQVSQSARSPPLPPPPPTVPIYLFIAYNILLFFLT